MFHVSCRFCFAFLSLLCFLPWTTPIADADEPLRIGVIVPLSGPVSWWGQSISRIAEYARKDVAGGRAVELHIEDDQFSAKSALSAANKLIEQDRVDAILTFSGGPSTAVSEICERKGVPMFGISAVDSYTTGKKSVFRIFMSNSSQMKQFTSEFDRKNLHRMSIATISQESALATRKVLLELNPSRFVTDEELAPDSRDMASIATKLLSKQPEGVVLLVNPPLLSMLSRSLRGQGYQGSIYGGVGTFSPAEIEASQGTLVGTVFPSPDRDKATPLIERYQREFHDVPASDALFAYDAIHFLTSRAADGQLSKNLNESTRFEGILGQYSREGNSLSVEASLWKVVSAHEMARSDSTKP